MSALQALDISTILWDAVDTNSVFLSICFIFPAQFYSYSIHAHVTK